MNPFRVALEDLAMRLFHCDSHNPSIREREINKALISIAEIVERKKIKNAIDCEQEAWNEAISHIVKLIKGEVTEAQEKGE